MVRKCLLELEGLAFGLITAPHIGQRQHNRSKLWTRKEVVDEEEEEDEKEAVDYLIIITNYDLLDGFSIGKVYLGPRWIETKLRAD